jgi:kynurenine formamidase
LTAGKGEPLGSFVDLSVTVDSSTMSPPSTNMRLEVTPHNRGPGFWQVSSVHQSLHTGAHIDSPLHGFKNGITTAEISLDQVMGEALVVDLSCAGAKHAITIDEFKKACAGDVKRGAIVLLRTDWTDKMYGKWPDSMASWSGYTAEPRFLHDPGRLAKVLRLAERLADARDKLRPAGSEDEGG